MNDVVKKGFMDDAEKLITTAVKQGDFDRGFEIVSDLYSHAETFAAAIGAGLDIMEQAWDKFEHEGGETFLDAAVRKTPLHPITIQNRINVRKLIKSGKIPDHLLDDISSLGQKSLIRIANTVRGGYEIEKKDWLALAETVGDKHVNAICRKIEGKDPRSNFVGLYYTSRGELLAFVEGEYKSIGELYKDKDPKTKRGQEVLISRAEIFEKANI